MCQGEGEFESGEVKQMNKDERTEIIVKLQRLDAQIRGAIEYLQSDLPLYPLGPYFTNPNETPNTFKIGDFTITDRFTEPH